MKHNRFILALISIAILVLSVSIAFAEEYMPYSSGANSVQISFKISDGVATAIGNTTALASGTSAKTTVYIQKLVDTTWKTIKTASGGSEASASCSVESGEIYRGRVVGKIYNSAGEKVDELSMNSKTKEAP